MIRVEDFRGLPDEWDRFVQQQAGWTHFQLFGWRRVIERVFGHECLSLVARDDTGTVVGVLPLVRIKSLLFGHFLVSMPFVSYGGPLGSTEAQELLLAHADGRARSDRVSLLQIRARGALPTPLAVGHHKLTVLVDIPDGGGEALFKQLSHKTRTKVRKPMKAGVEVRFGPEQLEPFHRVLATNMRDLGTPVQSLTFYRAIVETFPESTWIACAYLNGQAVAGGFGFTWGQEMEITWSSSLREHMDIRPGYLLHWAFLERAANAGLRVANFGRSTPGSGTHEYKRQWGGRDEVLWWYYRSASATASTPTPDDGRYSWGPRMWRKLPVGLATRLGPLIVRSIP